MIIDANGMAQKIEEAHNHNQRDIDEVETGESKMLTRHEHIGQGELAEMGIKALNRQTQKYGFSFAVATELDAYKAAYKLQFRANQTVVKSIKNEWSVEVYQ